MGNSRGRTVFRSKTLRLLTLRERLPNGRLMDVVAVERMDAAVVLPLIDAETVLVLKQFRPVIGKWIYELPAGMIERGERPESRARKELLEETGARARSMRLLFSSYATPGYSTEKGHFFVAKGLALGKPRLGRHELIKTETVKMGVLLSMIKDGRIVDGKTAHCLLYYNAFSRR